MFNSFVSFTACCRCYGQQRDDEHLEQHASGFLRALSKMLPGDEAVQKLLPQLVQLIPSGNKRSRLLDAAARMVTTPAAYETDGDGAAMAARAAPPTLGFAACVQTLRC